jgi:hypothetical protein
LWPQFSAPPDDVVQCGRDAISAFLTEENVKWRPKGITWTYEPLPAAIELANDNGSAFSDIPLPLGSFAICACLSVDACARRPRYWDQRYWDQRYDVAPTTYEVFDFLCIFCLIFLFLSLSLYLSLYPSISETNSSVVHLFFIFYYFYL